MALSNLPFSFENLGAELDRFLTELGNQASEYITTASASAGEVKSTLKNVVPRMIGDFPVDLTENETGYLITCEIPGIAKENLSVKLLTPTLLQIKTIPEEIAEPAAEDGVLEPADVPQETYHLHERRNGERQRTIVLPSSAKPQGAKATFVNGILEVMLPKDTSDEGIEIKIE